MADRISSYWVFNRPVNDMMRLQSSLNRTQEQISSGQGILSPSDDPVGSARVLQLDQEISLVSQYQRNITLVEARLEQEEGILVGVTNSIQRIRELAVQAGNGDLYSDSDRIAIAHEVTARVEELFDLTNSKDGNGEYLFSGFAGDTPSFARNPGGGYLYQGDEGVRHVQISRNATVAASDHGKDAFLDIPANVPSFYSYGNDMNVGQPPGVISQGMTVDQTALNDFFPENAVITFGNVLDMVPPGSNITVRNKSDGRVIEGLESVAYSSGDEISFAGMSVSITGNPAPGDTFLVDTSEKQGLLITVEKLAYALENFSTVSDFTTAYHDTIFNSLENLDSALDNISQVRTRIGARLNVTNNTTDQHADNKLAAQQIRSSIGDLDYAEAVSRLQMEEFVLKAAQQTYASVTKMSLFDFIR